MTANEHFVVDALPGEPRIVVCSPCSGHGFKFGPVVGQLAAEILLDQRRPPPEFALGG
jgi:sarcosine oxidase